MWRFISGISIPLIGSTYAKEMTKREPDWFNIREDIEGHYDFTQWAGFGYEMANSLWSFDYSEADELARVINLVNTLWNDNKKEIQPSKLTDIHFAITGKLHIFKNRDELIASIEDHGGHVSKDITKSTKYLINNDITSGSSKNVKAKQLNIPIITEDEFVEMFLTE